MGLSLFNAIKKPRRDPANPDAMGDIAYGDYGWLGNAFLATLPGLGPARGINEAMKTEPPDVSVPPPPPLAPDLTDAAIYEAGKAHAFNMGIGRNRRSTFLTGQSATSTMGQRKTLMGG